MTIAEATEKGDTTLDEGTVINPPLLVADSSTTSIMAGTDCCEVVDPDDEGVF